jgi:transcriptional regulator with XRE-family HTH domain
VFFLNTITRILKLLSEKGFKQIDLANHLKDKGVTKQTITDWKSGKSNSYHLYIVDIANFLKTTTDWLLTGEGERTVSSAIAQQYQSSDSEAMLFELLDAYRAADKEKRRAILQAALNTTADKTALGRTNDVPE